MSEKPDKYKDQIEEILKRAEEVMPKGRAKPPKGAPKNVGGSFQSLGRFIPGRGLSGSAGKLMLTSLGLLLVAAILGATGVGGVVFLVALGLVLFVIAYGLFFIRPTGTSYEKRWRGRTIEELITPWERLKRWFRS